MSPGPVLANALWLASGLPATIRFNEALEEPRAAQEKWLRETLVRHADSEFGREHEFSGIRGAADYVRNVPLRRYEDFEPYIARIGRGERDVLACGPVSHLAPTSGSSGPRKLIPFTPGLTTAFNAAVSPWMFDLVRQRPRFAGGPAYWSISPLAHPDGFQPSTTATDGLQPSRVPTDFADDADYLGGPRAWLVRQAMAVPSSVRFVADTDTFWRLTLLALLRRRDLRLISVWHPSFIELLIEAAGPAWKDLVDGVRNGQNPWSDALPVASRTSWQSSPDPGRAADLARIGATNWPAWWPELQVLSCWGEQAAESGWKALVRHVPQVLVQAKGLLATEGVVTIPLGSDRPLAVTSHYFEFLDEGGEVWGAYQLERGRRYEVIVTNGGGLWRYRLGDIVECVGHVAATPSLRFMGRDRVSDLRGEKLSEVFVGEVLRDLWAGDERPSFVTLRPRAANGTAGYELLVSGDSVVTDLAPRLDAALSANPHYAHARRLGQLSEVSVVRVSGEASLEGLRAHRGRVGDLKPRVLLDSAPGLTKIP